MNKFYALLLLSSAALSANAQQINGSFDGEWTDCTPWTSTGNTTKVGLNPKGWNVSNVYAVLPITVGDSVKGKDDEGYAIKLTNKSMAGQKVPGYITLGTPWATAETKLTSVRNADGGAFGGKKFAFHPDAISFDYKRDSSHGEEDATVVAYLWNGAWTQKDVPGNTALGTLTKWGTATTADMINRDRNILGMETATGGDTTSTEGATLVASLQQAITENNDSVWQSMTIPFAYAEGKEDAKVDSINVIFAATNYFGDRTKIVEKNSLTIDNVKLLYYHSLSALTATDNEGNAVELNFKADSLNYAVNSTYDEDWTEVEYKKVGVGATVDADYNAETAQYVITVKAEDYDAETNPDAITTYTIQYQKPAPTLSSLIVGGHEFIGLSSTETNFTATGAYNNTYEATSTEDGVEINSEFEKGDTIGAGKLTITLTKEGSPSSVYTITFEGKKKEGVYQIPNSDFEAWTTDGILANTWNSFNSASGLFSSFATMSPMPEKIEGFEGNGVRISSKDLWVAYANGNLTTGHINMGDTNPAAESNFNYTDGTDVNGNLPFAGTPDAFEVYARFISGEAKEEGIALNGRVQLILHDGVAYHDPELDSLAEHKIASASVIIPATSEWTKFEGEFNYVGEPTDNMYMLASATTNPVPGASKEDSLDLDNLKLIYYSTLTDLKLNGTTIDGFAENKTEYHVDAFINGATNDIAYTKKGRGAIVEENKDTEAGIITITVKGGDYAVDSTNKTVYTIYFDKTTGINSMSASEAARHTVYTLGGVRVNGKPAAGMYIVDGKKTMIK